jgi:hypothetical protein
MTIDGSAILMRNAYRHCRRRSLAAALSAMSIALAPMMATAAGLDEVLAWCKSSDSGDQRLCDLYVTNAVKLLRDPDPVLNGGHQACVPAGDPKKTVIPILTTWIKEHPDTQGKPPFEVMGEALSGPYPCK